MGALQVPRAATSSGVGLAATGRWRAPRVLVSLCPRVFVSPGLRIPGSPGPGTYRPVGKLELKDIPRSARHALLEGPRKRSARSHPTRMSMKRPRPDPHRDDGP